MLPLVVGLLLVLALLAGATRPVPSSPRREEAAPSIPVTWEP